MGRSQGAHHARQQTPAHQAGRSQKRRHPSTPAHGPGGSHDPNWTRCLRHQSPGDSSPPAHPRHHPRGDGSHRCGGDRDAHPSSPGTLGRVQPVVEVQKRRDPLHHHGSQWGGVRTFPHGRRSRHRPRTGARQQLASAPAQPLPDRTQVPQRAPPPRRPVART